MMKKIPEPVFILLVLASIPIISGLVSNFIPETYDNRVLIIIFSSLCVLALIGICAFSLIFIYVKILGLKVGSIKNIRKGIIDNDISKVADKIIYFQNRDKNINIIELIEQLEIENKKNKKPYINPFFRFSIIKENSDLYFNIPNNMIIKEENNEIIIYYKKLVYNVNKGMYIKK
jgi:hypothetical protein